MPTENKKSYVAFPKELIVDTSEFLKNVHVGDIIYHLSIMSPTALGIQVFEVLKFYTYNNINHPDQDGKWLVDLRDMRPKSKYTDSTMFVDDMFVMDKCVATTLRTAQEYPKERTLMEEIDEGFKPGEIMFKFGKRMW